MVKDKKPKKKKELYKKYRPKDLSSLYGQNEIKSAITSLLEDENVPHALLFCGPTGTGKTTVARILASELEVGDMDLVEMNAANCRGIDDIRRIESTMPLAPISGKNRMWIIDECHKLTGDAQNSLLKPAEDTPDHVYFILCTSEPEKLIPALRGRCSRFDFNKLDDKDLFKLLNYVLEEESSKLSDELVEKIIAHSQGSARNALVLLDKVIREEDEEKQLELITSAGVEKDAFQICQLLFKKNSTWKQMAALLRDVLKTDKDDQAEKLRRMILGYAKSILMKGATNQMAYLAIQEFRDDYFSCGTAGLVGSLYAVYNCDD